MLAWDGVETKRRTHICNRWGGDGLGLVFCLVLCLVFRHCDSLPLVPAVIGTGCSQSNSGKGKDSKELHVDVDVKIVKRVMKRLYVW